MHAVFALCMCVFTAQCRLDAAVLLYMSALLFTKITLQSSFWPHQQQVMGPRMWDFGRKQCCEEVNVIVIVPVIRSHKLNLGMSTTSDFKVQIEKLDVPDHWFKWKWQILMLLHAHCLEGITDVSQKCPVLLAEAQPQQKKEPTKWRQDDTKAALSHAR